VVDTATLDRATDRIHQHPGPLAPIERGSCQLTTVLGQVTEAAGQPHIQLLIANWYRRLIAWPAAGSPTSNQIRRRSRHAMESLVSRQPRAMTSQRPDGRAVIEPAAFRGPQGVRARSVSTGVTALQWCWVAGTSHADGQAGESNRSAMSRTSCAPRCGSAFLSSHVRRRVCLSIPRAIRSARSTSGAAYALPPSWRRRGGMAGRARGGCAFRVEATGHSGVVSSHWPPRGNAGVPGSCRVQLTAMMSMPMRLRLVASSSRHNAEGR
jgi:hypothetical protein